MTDWRECNATERDVLFALLADGPGTNREIQDRVDRPQATVSRALRKLDDKGLVDRDGDGKASGRTGTQNELSDKGRSVVVAAADRAREAL